MRRVLTTLVALCLALRVVLVANAAPAQTPGPPSDPALPADVTRFFHNWFAAVEAGDPDGILALVDSDFVIKWPVGHPISDRERLRAALAKMQQSVGQTVQPCACHTGWQVESLSGFVGFKFKPLLPAFLLS